MLQFRNDRTKESVTYTDHEILARFHEDPNSRSSDGFVINMILFLDAFCKQQGLEPYRITEEDWVRLEQLHRNPVPVPEKLF